jgi:hypothetical protein
VDRHVPPDAAQALARIVEALADPFAFAVALLGSEAVRMPSPPTEEEPRQRPPRPASRPAALPPTSCDHNPMRRDGEAVVGPDAKVQVRV